MEKEVEEMSNDNNGFGEQKEKRADDSKGF